MAFGAFVRLDGPVEGLIHISELSNRRIQHPKDVVKEGDVVPVKLVRIEKDRHRLGLSLRQARNDAEAMGFQFDANGAVIDYPDDIREQFQLPPRDKSLPPPRREPRTAQEAIEQAVSRDAEPISAFAHAFQQALEKEEGGGVIEEPTAEAGDSTAESKVNAGATAEAPVVEDGSAGQAEAEAPAVAAAEAEAENVAEAAGEPGEASGNVASAESIEEAPADGS
jgi:hypothetical protein